MESRRSKFSEEGMLFSILVEIYNEEIVESLDCSIKEIAGF